MTQFTTTSSKRKKRINLCRFLLPFFTKSLNKMFQFMMISAKQAPMRPNIPPLAPTEIFFGKKIALITVPPTAGIKKMIREGKNP